MVLAKRRAGGIETSRSKKTALMDGRPFVHFRGEVVATSWLVLPGRWTWVKSSPVTSNQLVSGWWLEDLEEERATPAGPDERSIQGTATGWSVRDWQMDLAGRPSGYSRDSPPVKYGGGGL